MIGDDAATAPPALHSLIRSLRAPESKARIASADAVLEALQRVGAEGGRRSAGPRATTAGGPSRFAWAVAGMTVALGVGALVTAVSFRGTSGVAQAADVRSRTAPVPIRAVAR